ncbi:MAG: response regulator [Candidatus Methanomethylophilaceae archaeon]|nr:response regulator [Candidatus Methanomethylophilaceae archaeon]
MVRVLVVEDNPELNDTVCSFLEYSGHSVVGCLCAKEARQRFLDERFDIIVSDIMMPDEDGYEFVESIVLLDVLCTDLLCDELLVVLSHPIHRSHDFGIGIIKGYVGMNDIFRVK